MTRRPAWRPHKQAGGDEETELGECRSDCISGNTHPGASQTASGAGGPAVFSPLIDNRVGVPGDGGVDVENGESGVAEAGAAELVWRGRVSSCEEPPAQWKVHGILGDEPPQPVGGRSRQEQQRDDQLPQSDKANRDQGAGMIADAHGTSSGSGREERNYTKGKTRQAHHRLFEPAQCRPGRSAWTARLPCPGVADCSRALHVDRTLAGKRMLFS